MSSKYDYPDPGCDPNYTDGLSMTGPEYRCARCGQQMSRALFVKQRDEGHRTLCGLCLYQALTTAHRKDVA